MRRSDGLKPEVDLYSATIAVGATGGMFTIFHAILAVSPEAALERVAARLGPQIAQYASIERGFDPTNPFAQMLVSAPMRKLLSRRRGGSAVAAGSRFRAFSRPAASWITVASGTQRCATPYGVECAFGALAALFEGVDECLRSLSDGLAPVAEAYLEGARGNLIHSRDALRKAVEPDCGARWRVRLERGSAAEQVGDLFPLSWREADFDEPIGYVRPDLGASLMSSARIADLAGRRSFAALLASAIAEHTWLHLATGTSWSCSWPTADALVRALNGGRPFPRLGHRDLRGTVDRDVAVELAELGWRRLSSPGLLSP